MFRVYINENENVLAFDSSNNEWHEWSNDYEEWQSISIDSVDGYIFCVNTNDILNPPDINHLRQFIVFRVDLRSSSIPHYLVWQKLFNIFRFQGANLDDNMWDMLCDLNIIESIFKRKETAFYWEVSGNYTQITIAEKDRPLKTPHFTGDLYLVCIDYEKNKVTISKESM